MSIGAGCPRRGDSPERVRVALPLVPQVTPSLPNSFFDSWIMNAGCSFGGFHASVHFDRRPFDITAGSFVGGAGYAAYFAGSHAGSGSHRFQGWSCVSFALGEDARGWHW